MADEKNTTIEEEQNIHEEETENIAPTSDDSKDEESETEEMSQEEPSIDTELEQLRAELDETKNRLLRTQADFDNFRRRTQKEKESAQIYRAQSLLEDLLPVVDNFERAIAVKTDDEQVQSIIKGMEMVYRQLTEAMKKEGLEEIETVGKEFDPHVHQAIMQVEDENFGSNIVVEELQKGYRLKDRVIRASMVKVNQ